MKHRIKTILVMLIPLLLGWIIRSYLGSYSYFSDSNFSIFNVTAASQEDIIKFIQINPINPDKISITKADNLKYEPVVYFEMEGELKDYIKHVNPIKLNESVKSEQIITSISIPQFLNLINNQDTKNITGKIYVKYLNEYINTPFDIEFTRLYIINEYLKSIGISELGSLDDRAEVDNALLQLQNIFENGESDVLRSAQKAVEDYEKSYVETLDAISAAEGLELITWEKVGLLSQGTVRAELEERILVRTAVIEMIKEKLQNQSIEPQSIAPDVIQTEINEANVPEDSEEQIPQGTSTEIIENTEANELQSPVQEKEEEVVNDEQNNMEQELNTNLLESQSEQLPVVEDKETTETSDAIPSEEQIDSENANQDKIIEQTIQE